jgi:hypothetical protein
VNKDAYTLFMSLSPEQQRFLVSKIQILDNSPNIIDIQKEITNVVRISIRPKFLQIVCQHIEGMWFDTVINHLLEKTDNNIPSIPYQKIQTAIHDIQDQYRGDNLPDYNLMSLEVDDKQAQNDERVFVQQLHLIKAKIKLVQKAISDYHRSSMLRSQWIRDGLMLLRELEKYDGNLYDEWERYQARIEDEHSDNPSEDEMCELGKRLFYKIEDLDLRIRPSCDLRYMMRGSYHILSDQLKVGWHKDFKKRISQ